MTNEASSETLLTQTVEVQLNANTLIVLECPAKLSFSDSIRLSKQLEDQLDKPGRRVLVLSDGITLKVIQRPLMDGTAP